MSLNSLIWVWTKHVYMTIMDTFMLKYLNVLYQEKKRTNKSIQHHDENP